MQYSSADRARHSPVSLLDQGANYKHCWPSDSQETFHPASHLEEMAILQAPFSNKQLQTPQHFPGVSLFNSVFCPNSNFNSDFLSSRFPCLTLISLSHYPVSNHNTMQRHCVFTCAAPAGCSSTRRGMGNFTNQIHNA